MFSRFYVYRQTGMVFFVLSIFLFLSISVVFAEQNLKRSIIVVGDIEGVIGGATRDYVDSLISYASENNASLIILKINTPGGTLSFTLDIIELIDKSPIPIVGYVVDRWAMSAGTIILLCTHYAAMEPGTIIGAVQPVSMSPSGEYRPLNETKLLNPIYKQIETCMKKHDRNFTVAKKFVYENLVLDDVEALKYNVIETTAANINDLIARINGSTIKLQGSEYTVVLANPVVEYYEMRIGLKIAQFLSDPIVSSIITSIAMLVILAALASGEPSLIAVGIVLLIIGFFGIGFSASMLSLTMLIIGIAMLLAELLSPGFGLIGASGIILLVLGSFMLFGGKPMYISKEAMVAAQRIVLSTILPLAALFSLIVYKAIKVVREKPVYVPSVVGKHGVARDFMEPGKEGFVMIEGEYWRSLNVDEEAIKPGEEVVVVKKEGPILYVKKKSEKSR